MADDIMVNEVSSVAAEWDMLYVTSSVYASPIFRRGFDPINLPGYGGVSDGQEGTHPGLVMSDGFVFPPSEHENLPIESQHENLPIEPEDENLLREPEHKNLPIEPEHDESNANSHVTPEEVDGSTDENVPVNSDLPAVSETTLPDSSLPGIHAKEKKTRTTCKSEVSCEGWWKRNSTHLYHHIKGVTTVCSVVAAGAVVGFVVMGQKWQHDRWHFHELHLNINSESMGRVIGIFSRLRDGLPGSQQLRSLLPTRVLPPQPLSA